jgi:Kef-type K+ transport system membrane component KefB
MIEPIRYIWQNLVLTGVLIVTGITIFTSFPLEMTISHFLSMVLSYSLINIVAWIMMYRGIRKNNRDGMVILLAGLGGKFILYLLYILVFWLVVKNISKAFILTFFTLYLVFTFLMVFNLVKLLNNK